MLRYGIKVVFITTDQTESIVQGLAYANALKDEVTFESILREVVKKKSNVVRNAYEEMFGVIGDDTEK